MSLKEQALRTIEKLPDDASLDELIDRLYLTFKIEHGIAQADAGEGISHEDARQRMAQWLE
jgi:predicted transcriptional regulator